MEITPDFFLKFERLIETYFAFAPKGLISFLKSMPIWIKEKLFLKDRILKEMDAVKYRLHRVHSTHFHLLLEQCYQATRTFCDLLLPFNVGS